MHQISEDTFVKIIKAEYFGCHVQLSHESKRCKEQALTPELKKQNKTWLKNQRRMSGSRPNKSICRDKDTED